MLGSFGGRCREFYFYNGEEFGTDCKDMNYKFLPAASAYPKRERLTLSPYLRKSLCLHLHRAERAHCNSSSAKQYLQRLIPICFLAQGVKTFTTTSFSAGNTNNRRAEGIISVVLFLRECHPLWVPQESWFLHYRLGSGPELFLIVSGASRDNLHLPLILLWSLTMVCWLWHGLWRSGTFCG